MYTVTVAMGLWKLSLPAVRGTRCLISARTNLSSVMTARGLSYVPVDDVVSGLNEDAVKVKGFNTFNDVMRWSSPS